MLAALDNIVWDKQTLAVVGGCAIGLAAVVGCYWYKFQKVRSDNELKRLMIERGMSADEIERVIAAGDGDEDEGAAREPRASHAGAPREARVN